MEKTMIGGSADFLYGHVNGECYAITNTIEQITAFISKYATESVKITNFLDLLEIETSMGFIMHCPNQTFLQKELLPHLVPIQRGEEEAEEFIPHVFEKTEDEEYEAKEVAVHLSLYFKIKKGETDEEAQRRAHELITEMTEDEEGIDYQLYDTDVREI